MSSVQDFAQDVQSRYGLETFSLYERPDGSLYLQTIEVPRGYRKQGVGSQVMAELTSFADQRGSRIVLSPDVRDAGRGTTSRARLVRFYKRFGFVENKGRHKDYRISEGMYREPHASNPEDSSVNFADLYHSTPEDTDLGRALRYYLGTELAALTDRNMSGETDRAEEVGYHYWDSAVRDHAARHGITLDEAQDDLIRIFRENDPEVVLDPTQLALEMTEPRSERANPVPADRAEQYDPVFADGEMARQHLHTRIRQYKSEALTPELGYWLVWGLSWVKRDTDEFPPDYVIPDPAVYEMALARYREFKTPFFARIREELPSANAYEQEFLTGDLKDYIEVLREIRLEPYLRNDADEELREIFRQLQAINAAYAMPRGALAESPTVVKKDAASRARNPPPRAYGFDHSDIEAGLVRLRQQIQRIQKEGITPNLSWQILGTLDYLEKLGMGEAELLRHQPPAEVFQAAMDYWYEVLKPITYDQGMGMLGYGGDDYDLAVFDIDDRIGILEAIARHPDFGHYASVEVDALKSVATAHGYDPDRPKVEYRFGEESPYDPGM